MPVTGNSVHVPPPYLQPEILADALTALSQAPLVPLAGGTDFYPARVGQCVVDGVLDLSRVAELRGFERAPSAWRFGALTTWSDVRRAALPRALRSLQGAAAEIGGVQVQNAGTLGGNLCNASPAADGVPALLALDAEVELRSVRGARSLPLQAFILGKQRTARAPDELLTAIRVPAFGPRTRSTFRKLGARRYLVISVAAVAARVDFDESRRVTGAAIAVGACSEVAQRLGGLESRMKGVPVGALGDIPCAGDLDALSPRSDVRGSAAYRRDAVLQLLRRALEELGDE